MAIIKEFSFALIPTVLLMVYYFSTPTSLDGFSLSIHEQITQEALPFLKAEILKEINEGHHKADSLVPGQLHSEYHFDNCAFLQATQNINNLYSQVVVLLWVMEREDKEQLMGPNAPR